MVIGSVVSEILGGVGGGTTPQVLLYCQKEQMLLTVNALIKQTWMQHRRSQIARFPTLLAYLKILFVPFTFCLIVENSLSNKNRVSPKY